MSKFLFIDRSSPGAGHHYDDCRRPAILQLPIAQYPTIAPPAVAISATYPGADAQTVQDTVTRLSSRI